MSACYSSRLDDALAFAARHFRHIRRKGSGVPYLSHLLSVAGLVADHGGDEDQIIAALLHDVLEDIAGVSEADIADQFGERVARLVRGLSDTTERPKPPWETRKRAYLARLPAEPAELKLICAADKLHNCTTLLRDYGSVGEVLWERFTADREQTLWYYRELVEALRVNFDHLIVGELRGAVAQLHARVGHPGPGPLTS